MPFSSGAESRHRVKLGDLVVIDHVNSSGTEESYLLTSESSAGNCTNDFMSETSVDNNFLLALSDDSSDEDLPLTENSVEEPLLKSDVVSTSYCLCMPISRKRSPLQKMRLSNSPQMNENHYPNPNRNLYRSFADISEAEMTSSVTDVENDPIESRPNEGISGEGNSERGFSFETPVKNDFLLGIPVDCTDSDLLLSENLSMEPLLETDVVAANSCMCTPNRRKRTCSHKIVESNSQQTNQNNSLKPLRNPYHSFKNQKEVHVPLSVIEFDCNAIESRSTPAANTATARSGYHYMDRENWMSSKDIGSTSDEDNFVKVHGCSDKDLHDELDELVSGVRAPLDTMRVPLDFQLSTLYEEDEDVITQSTPSGQNRSKTQKLAEYLKRDGETYFDYESLSLQSSLETSSLGENEFINHLGEMQCSFPSQKQQLSKYDSTKTSIQKDDAVLFELRQGGHPGNQEYGNGEIISPATSEEISELTEELSPVVALLPQHHQQEANHASNRRSLPLRRASHHQVDTPQTYGRQIPLWGCLSKRTPLSNDSDRAFTYAPVESRQPADSGRQSPLWGCGSKRSSSPNDSGRVSPPGPSDKKQPASRTFDRQSQLWGCRSKRSSSPSDPDRVSFNEESGDKKSSLHYQCLSDDYDDDNWVYEPIQPYPSLGGMPPVATGANKDSCGPIRQEIEFSRGAVVSRGAVRQEMEPEYSNLREVKEGTRSLARKDRLRSYNYLALTRITI